jgi:hypothetical protein
MSWRLVSLGFLSALLLVPSVARADEYDDAVPLTPLKPATAAPAAPPAPPAAASSAAPASSTTIDTVQMRNGTVYRGKVLEILPNSHVSISVPGEPTKKVPWADVEKVIVASYTGPLPPSASSGSPVPYVAPSTPAIEAPMVGPKARVHISGGKRVILYRKPAGTNAWSQACSTPCDTELPIGDSYRLTGNGVPQTKEFRLQASPGGAVDLHIDPPSTPGILLGGTMAYGGAGTAYVGLIMTLLGLDNGGSSYRGSDSDLRDAGLVTMAVGAGIGALGLVVFLNSSTTDIEQHSSSGKGDSAAAKPSKLDAFVRQPAWTATASRAPEAASQAPGAAFPLLLTKTF